MVKNILISILTITVFHVFNSCTNVRIDTTYPDLPILHLNGTPFENGFQHGRIMKSRIVELVGLWKNDIEKNYQIPADTFIKILLDSTDYILRS
jgi:hypothetical protein